MSLGKLQIKRCPNCNALFVKSLHHQWIESNRIQLNFFRIESDLFSDELLTLVSSNCSTVLSICVVVGGCACSLVVSFQCRTCSCCGMRYLPMESASILLTMSSLLCFSTSRMLVSCLLPLCPNYRDYFDSWLVVIVKYSSSEICHRTGHDYIFKNIVHTFLFFYFSCSQVLICMNVSCQSIFNSVLEHLWHESMCFSDRRDAANKMF